MAEPARLGYAGATRWFLAAALVALPGADLAISGPDPWAEVGRLLAGILRPEMLAVAGRSVVLTVAFAVLGVALGALAGLLLALVFARLAPVRALAAAMRSVHELFWALLLIQVTGLSPLTGILAIAIPYAGIFAKVFSEIIEEADLAADRVLPHRTDAVSRFAYARIPVLAGTLRHIPALPVGVRDALHPRARLHRPADHGLRARDLLPAGPLRRGRGLRRRLLPADRHAPALVRPATLPVLLAAASWRSPG
jgi:phosphonate transport system permease protein